MSEHPTRTVRGWMIRVFMGLIIGGLAFLVLSGSLFIRGFLPTIRGTRYIEATRTPAGDWALAIVGDDPNLPKSEVPPDAVRFEVQEQSSGRVGPWAFQSWRAGSCIVTSMMIDAQHWTPLDQTTGDASLDSALVTFVEGTLIPTSLVINQWPLEHVVAPPRQGFTWWRRQHQHVHPGRLVFIVALSIAAGAAVPLTYVARTRRGPSRDATT